MARDSSRWITKGIKVWFQRIRFLNNFKRNLTLTREVLNYINRYHSIYKRVTSEAERERERIIGWLNQMEEFLDKDCIQYIKKPLIFICNVSINQGIFP